MDEITLSTEFEQVEPADVYACWIDADKHAEMTGGAASGESSVDAAFTAWDGYISGKHLELEAGKRILQSWRTTQFPEGSPDSKLEVTFATNGEGGCIVTLKHWDIPEGDGLKYISGWEEHYFDPMREYFGDDAFDDSDNS